MIKLMENITENLESANCPKDFPVVEKLLF